MASPLPQPRAAMPGLVPAALDISPAVAPDPRFAGPRTLFFGVGTAKAGTTWLHMLLARHPDAAVPAVKELHYWSAIRPPHNPYAADRTRALKAARRWRDPVLRLVGDRRRREKAEARQLWIRLHEADDPAHGRYADCLFQMAGKAAVVGEITGNYCLLEPSTLAEMAALSPRSRFVFIMRDPVARLHSAVKHRLRVRGGEDFATPKSVNAVLAALLAEIDSLDSYEREPYDLSRYDICLANLSAGVAPERVAVFFYESLFTPEETERVQRFLGLDPIAFSGEARINTADSRESGLDPGLAADLRRALAPAYDHVAAAYPDAAPAGWMW